MQLVKAKRRRVGQLELEGDSDDDDNAVPTEDSDLFCDICVGLLRKYGEAE